MPPKGLKKQVFGGVLVGLGVIYAILARLIGFEPDLFYIILGATGVFIFLYGSVQNNTP